MPLPNISSGSGPRVDGCCLHWAGGFDIRVAPKQAAGIVLGIIAVCSVCPSAAPAEHKELVAEAEGSFSPAGQPTPCLSHEYPCGLGICLNASLVCSGHQDCADGSDEGGNCSLPCQRPCSQLCYPSPQGPVSAADHGLGFSPHCASMDCTGCSREPHALAVPTALLVCSGLSAG